jgi:hypothetical protein
MTPQEAGWRLVDDPDAGPADCAGSRQLIMAPAVPGARYPCPSCGQYIRTDGDPPAFPVALITHQPPATVAPTLSLGL